MEEVRPRQISCPNQRSKPLLAPNEKRTADFTRRSPFLTAVLPGLYPLASNLPTALLADLRLMADQRVEEAFKAPGPTTAPQFTLRDRYPGCQMRDRVHETWPALSPKPSHRETHLLARLFGNRHM